MLISFTFQSLWMKINSKLNWKFRIKIYTAILCKISGYYLMYKLICQKPAHSLSAQDIFFEVFIVLGMYNFGFELTIISCLVWNIINLGTKPFLDTKESFKKLLLTFKAILYLTTFFMSYNFRLFHVSLAKTVLFL